MKAYLEQVAKLLAVGKTTGNNHSEDMLHYTRMNLKRMNRWMKKGQISPEVESVVKNIREPQKWVVLTEAWCGDAAHVLPFIAKITELNPNIRLEIKLRDENLELMDQHLTNGGRSIPKLIAFDEEGNEMFEWGPRPAVIQDAFLQMKAADIDPAERTLELQKRYNQDKGQAIQTEIAEKIRACEPCMA